MDSVDVCTDPATRDNKRRVDKKNRVWCKRLHCRKSAVQPPTMQSKDKNGPKKKSPAEKVQKSTESPSSKAAQSSQQRTTDANSRLKCIKCKDDVEYIPKDLVKHFEENHSGTQPVFPCHVCTFTTPELSFLQVHLLSHKDTFSSCIVCQDDVERTWSELSAHLTLCHSQSGKFLCETCRKFSAEDPGVFIEHMYSRHLGLEGFNQVDVVPYPNDNNLLGCKTNTMLRCQHCSYETSRKWMLTNHMNTNHVSLNGSQRRDKHNSRANSTIPRANHRLTRSAVRETCWLTQDCLDIPGREFLDKYCHLPDPQKTLEQTQQFLMKSVTEGAGGQQLTKALQSVLSSVPQDINLHAMTENGITADLTVLTVKNKITVAPNGATYAKRRKVMVEKESQLTEGGVDFNAQNGRPENLHDQTHCSQAEARLNDASPSTQDVRLECARSRENGENQILKTAVHNHQHASTKEEDASETDKIQEQTPAGKALPRAKRKKGGRKRKARCKKQSVSSELKIVLKKNPVKERQWVSKSSVSPPPGGAANNQEPTIAHATKQDSTKDEPTSREHQKTNAENHETSKAILATLQSTTQMGREASKESPVKKEQEQDYIDVLPGEDVALDPERSGSRTLSSVAQPAITPHVPSDQREEDLPEDGETPDSESFPDQAVEQSPLPGIERRWQPAPKNLLRTLRIIAASPSQLVKRPFREQPIVVLNHPDAEIPEVAKIMNVINKNKGEVQKVVLSRRTLSAISATTAANDTDPEDHHPTVQERFILKMKLRRVNRKKYEVVEGVSPGLKVERKYRCWFCGRIFPCQQMLMAHRRRHLAEWRGSHCENFGTSLTLK